MRDGTKRRGKLLAWLMVSTCPWLLPAAAAGEKLIHGFERLEGLEVSGKVAQVRGADAVTEGSSALQFAPGASVRIKISPGSLDRPGWLRIDTFEVQPVMACLQISLEPLLTRDGHVRPGKDTLALPLGLAARTDTGPWPRRPVVLEIKNTTSTSIVLDNVRLTPPASAPEQAVLLDFGPRDQVLWPGFEHAEWAGNQIAWSGQALIYAFSVPFPDPLTGDFAGPHPGYRTQEKLVLMSPKGPGVGWVWLTHYSSQYSAPLEYRATLNGRSVVQRRFSPAEMLSPAGLLEGKDQPWTNEWFEQSFVPNVVSECQFSLKAGLNVLQLANCQVAALAIAPREQQRPMQQYLRETGAQLSRYRRQFVLATQHRPSCEVPPTEDEAKAGVMLFLPPAEARFNRVYAPVAEHRGDELRFAAAAGSQVTTAIVAVPCNDTRLLQLSIDSLRSPSKGAIPARQVQILALERMPLARGGRVYFQPFLPTRSFRAVKARGVYWFILQFQIPERAPSGTYHGTLRLKSGKGAMNLPVAADVFAVPGDQHADDGRTFGVFSDGNCFQVYHSLGHLLPAQRRGQVTRQVFSGLFSAGLNAGIVPGPSLSGTLTPIQNRMIEGIRAYPKPARPGKALIDLTRGVTSLRARRIQPGTARYVMAVRDLARSATELAQKSGLTNHALFMDYVHGPSQIPTAIRLIRPVRDGGGRPAVSMRSSHLAAADPAHRAELFAALDTLICSPDSKDLGAIRDEFKASGAGKSLLLSTPHADTYTCGFYAWGIGADGVLIDQIFSSRPIFSAFWFDGRSLIVPTAQGRFEPTLALLQLQQAIDDYALAKRCEGLIKPASARRIETAALEKLLAGIRAAADTQAPGFDLERWRTRSIHPANLSEWREALAREAAKIARELRM